MEKISSASCARKAFRLPYGKSVKLEHSLHTNIPKKKKKKFKKVERPKYKTWHNKTPRKEHRQNIFWHKS